MINVDSSYLEDFEVGDKAVSPGRTVTEADIVMFAGLSGDWSALHTNVEVMKGSPFGQRIAHGLLTLSIASGLALRTRGRPPPAIVAFLGMDKVRFENPVFIGDTITVESEVIEARPSKSIPDAGILKFRNTVRNQHNENTATWETALVVRRKPKKM
jgi:acyl dehydratase